MSEKFKNKYRIESSRACWHDYNTDCIYSVTICTARRECYFGEVREKKILLSDNGEIANHCWIEISDKFCFAELGPYVIMPDHVHGLIKINRDHLTDNKHKTIRPVETQFIASPGKNEAPKISDSFIPDDSHGGFAGCLNPMINNGLSKVLRWYKGRVTFEIRKKEFCFAWQPRYYDHIITNDHEYKIYKNYIEDNPSKWITQP